VSAAGKKIPVLVSPVVVIDGAVFDPAPKIPVVTVTLPVLIVALVMKVLVVLT